MSGARLPPEIFDYIVDFLHDQSEALRRCCLVSKSWVPRTQKHLLGDIIFWNPSGLETWKETFPDPANSPSAHHTRSLTFRSREAIIAVVEGGDYWIRVFCNIVQLELSLRFSHLDPPSRFHILTLICSFPRLEDLTMSGLRIATKDDDNAVFQLLTSPPLTGTLAISRSHKEHLVAWLLDLPNGLCFQKFEFLWRGETDGQWVTALVEACSDTLEHVDLCSQVTVRENASAAAIDFSKAMKLTNVVFRSEEQSILWIIMALKTITSGHRNLREVAVHIDFCHILFFLSNPANAGQTVGDEIYSRWADLDRLLVQLSESGAVHVRVRCWSSGLGYKVTVREYVEGLLPEMAKGGGTKLLYYGDL